MDGSERRLLLFDQYGHKLYRIAVLLVQNYDAAQQILFEVFASIQPSGKAMRKTSWQEYLTIEMARRCLDDPSSISEHDQQRALSILVHYGRLHLPYAAELLGLSESKALHALRELEHNMHLTPSQLAHCWQMDVVLAVVPPSLRKGLYQMQPASNGKATIGIACAAIAASVVIMLGMANETSAHDAPSPTATIIQTTAPQATQDMR